MASLPPVELARAGPVQHGFDGVPEALPGAGSRAQRATGPALGPGLVHRKQSGRGDALRLENTVEERAERRARRAAHRTITRARLLDQDVRQGGRRGRWLMVTLTYREDVDWQPNHLRAFSDAVRQWYRRRGEKPRYVWAMELTARGRPHYHMLIWVPHWLRLPQPDRQGWWRHGMTRTEVARNAVGYLAKYASKGLGYCNSQGELYLYPKGSRISGGTAFRAALGAEWRYWTAPRWVREAVEQLTDVRRVTGGFIVVETGELLRSPWRYVGVSPDGKWLLFEPRDCTESADS